MLFTCGDKNSLALAEMTLQIEEDAIHNDNNYNKAIAGQRFLGPTKHTDATKEKVRQFQLGRQTSDETKAKLSEAMKGIHSGAKHPSFKDVIVSQNIATGEINEYIGKASIQKAGFNHSTVTKAISGKKYWHKDSRYVDGGHWAITKTHKGCKWYWKEDYLKLIEDNNGDK
mgnify:FL=1